MEKDYSLIDHRQFLSEIVNSAKDKNFHILECEKSIAIIDAMTEEDRKAIDKLDEQAIARLAVVSETTTETIQEFLFQFTYTREMFLKVGRMSWWQRIAFLLGFRKP